MSSWLRSRSYASSVMLIVFVAIIISVHVCVFNDHRLAHVPDASGWSSMHIWHSEPCNGGVGRCTSVLGKTINI